MNKKVTIHDIAREAGVSAATVSYIINDRTDKSKKKKTRQRVLHIVNVYNYKPAAFAKNLRSTPDFKLIAIFSEDSDSLLYGGEFQYFLTCLSETFPIDKYGLILCRQPYRRIEQADAIIAYNTSLASFRAIADANYVPLIAVDCIPNDKLFYQITTDYDKLRENATKQFGDDYTFVCLAPPDKNICLEIKKAFPNGIFIDDLSALFNVQSRNNIVTCDKTVAEYFKNTNKNVLFPQELYKAKCDCILSCMESVLQRIPFDTHFYKI